MEIIWAVFLGAIQGITEVLPISSSGHLVLMPWFFKVTDQGLAFDVALHLGSLFAIIIAFYPEWHSALRSLPGLMRNNFRPKSDSEKIILLLAVATIPGALAGFFLNDFVESALRSPAIIVFTLIFYGLVLIAADKYGKKSKEISEIGFKEAAMIGGAQALALIPGTSRSGITISAGLALGFKKEVAAKFSFMISAPIIFGAALVKLPELKVDQVLSFGFLLGILSAFAFALLAIKFILKYVQKHSYYVFAYYRFFLAILILIFILRS